MRTVGLIVLISASFAVAQQRMENVRVARPSGMERSASEAKVKVTPEQKQQAEQIIAASISEARAIEDSGGRAYALLQVARALQASDKKTATELLEESLAAVRAMDEDRAQTKQRLQKQVLKSYVSLAPERADKLVDELDVDGRRDVLTSLLSYYEQRKQTKRALEVIYRIGQESEIPYGVAARLIASMKPEQSSDAQELFTAALNSYRTHGQQRPGVGPGSFADLISSSWQRLPSGLVKAGIDEVLANAQRSEKEGQGRQMNISMVSDKGALEFNSEYELALFQLAPILKQIAPSEAESRLKQSQATRENLERFPKGLPGFGHQESPQGGEETRGPGMMMSMDRGEGNAAPSGPPPGMPTPMEMMQVGKIVGDSREHPQDALAQAAVLGNSTAKSDAYIGIARTNIKKNPSITKQALDKAMEQTVADSQMQILRLDEAAELYLQLGESDDAKKVVEQKMEAAEKAYREDTNADKPNTALKAYWPSTAAWRSAIGTATRISPEWAQTLLKEIDDPEIRTLNQIALASALLDVPSDPVTIITQTKDGVSVMSQEMPGR